MKHALFALLAFVFAAFFGFVLLAALLCALFVVLAFVAFVLAGLLARLGGGFSRGGLADIVSRALCKGGRAEQQERPKDECDVLHGDSPVVIAP